MPFKSQDTDEQNNPAKQESRIKAAFKPTNLPIVQKRTFVELDSKEVIRSMERARRVQPGLKQFMRQAIADNKFNSTANNDYVEDYTNMMIDYNDFTNQNKANLHNSTSNYGKDYGLRRQKTKPVHIRSSHSVLKPIGGGLSPKILTKENSTMQSQESSSSPNPTDFDKSFLSM